MLESGFSYLAVLAGVAGGLMLLARHSGSRVFEVLPAIVILYLLVIVLSSLGVWRDSPSDRKSVV